MPTSNNDVTWQLDTHWMCLWTVTTDEILCIACNFSGAALFKVCSRFCGMYYINTRMFCNTPQTGYGRYAAILVISVIWAVNLKHFHQVCKKVLALQGQSRIVPCCSAKRLQCRSDCVGRLRVYNLYVIKVRSWSDNCISGVYAVLCLPYLKWSE